MINPKSKEGESASPLNGHCVEHGRGTPGKVVNDPPTTVYDVHQVRNTGSPTQGDLHGDGFPIVVSERESRLQGKGGKMGDSLQKKSEEKRNATDDTLHYERERRADRKGCPDLKPVGEPDARKGARPCLLQAGGSERGGWKRAVRQRAGRLL